MAGELPGLTVDLARILPEIGGVVDRLAPMRMRPTRRTLTALSRMARLARRFSAENGPRTRGSRSSSGVDRLGPSR